MARASEPEKKEQASHPSQAHLSPVLQEQLLDAELL